MSIRRASAEKINLIKKSGRRKKVYWLLGSMIVIILIFLLWLYSGNLTGAKLKIFQAVPLPMALVNLHALPMNDFLARFSSAQKVLGDQQAQALKQQLVEQSIKDAEVNQLAFSRDVNVTQKQIDQEYSAVAANTNLNGSANFESYLASQGLNENLFKQNIIKPSLLEKGLQVWFNSQRNLNPDSYKQADSLVSQIQAGADMGLLAKQYSQDAQAASLAGDMGFLQVTDLSPELRETVGSMKPGDIKIIPNQNGLYVMRLENQIGNQIHLRAIFLKNPGFNDWLNAQLKNFKVINLLKI